MPACKRHLRGSDRRRRQRRRLWPVSPPPRHRADAPWRLRERRAGTGSYGSFETGGRPPPRRPRMKAGVRRIMARRLRTWLLALALAAPLVAITAWVIHGATDPPARPPASRRAGGRVARPAPTTSPTCPSERLEERVDGAADALRADGCRRLVLWRFEQPPADAEALFFARRGRRARRPRSARRAPSGRRAPGTRPRCRTRPSTSGAGRSSSACSSTPAPRRRRASSLARAVEIDRALRAGARDE